MYFCTVNVNSRVMICTLSSRFQSFQPCGPLNWFGKIEINAPIHAVILFLLLLLLLLLLLIILCTSFVLWLRFQRRHRQRQTETGFSHHTGLLPRVPMHPSTFNPTFHSTSFASPFAPPFAKVGGEATGSTLLPTINNAYKPHKVSSFRVCSYFCQWL